MQIIISCLFITNLIKFEIFKLKQKKIFENYFINKNVKKINQNSTLYKLTVNKKKLKSNHANDYFK